MFKKKLEVFLTALNITFKGILSKILSLMRAYFLTGLIVLLPSSLTIYLIFLLFTWADTGFVAEIVFKILGRKIPGLGVIFTFVVIIGSGIIARNFIGQKVFALVERVLYKIPLAKNIMTAVRQLLEFINTNKKAVFNKVVLVEYPRRDCWVLGFVSTDAPEMIANNFDNQKMWSVFIPTTPNPTSGFLIFVSKNEVVELDITMEDAMKIIISGGVLSPEGQEKAFLVKDVLEDEE
ncbi:MAG: DUF502 domain-containing protein [Candidatus Muiribacteriota bacterium]|jgi:uncharacterized membrane protein